MAKQTFHQQLRQAIGRRYSLDELRTLVFDLELDWDELAGPLKSNKIASLIKKMEQQERLAELLEQLSQEHPRVKWPEAPPVRAETAVFQGNGNQEDLFQEYLDKMAGLLLQNGLGPSSGGKPVQAVAQALTDAALARLDGQYRKLIFRFLAQASLFCPRPIIRLDGQDFSGLDLSGLYLSQATLNRVNLRGSDLSQTNLSRATLSKAFLNQAKLCAANLSRANLAYAYLQEADLSQANLSGATLRRADLTEANLTGAELKLARVGQANLTKARLMAAVLTRAKLAGAVLCRADLRRADLGGADLRRADLTGADLRMADLSGSYPFRTNLTAANLSGADLTGADLRRVILDEALLMGAKVTADQLSHSRSCREAILPNGRVYDPSATLSVQLAND